MQDRIEKRHSLIELIKYSYRKSNLLKAIKNSGFTLTADEEGNTPLHQLACCSNYSDYSDSDTVDIFKYLLENNYSFNFNSLNLKDLSPFDVSILNSNYELALVFLEHGAIISSDIKGINTTLITLFRLQITILRLYQQEPEQGQAISNKIDLIIAKIFLQIDKNIQDENGNNLLHIAILDNPLPNLLVKLIQEGVKITHENNAKLTAIDLAAKRDYLSEVLILLTHGASPSIINYNSQNLTCEQLLIHALFKAIEKRDLELLNQIAGAASAQEKTNTIPNFKAKIFNSLNEEGLTALHIATKKGNIDLIKSLLEYGTSVHAPSSTGIMPLLELKNAPQYLSNDSSHVTIISLYQKYGVNLDDTDKEGHVLLHHYCFWDRSEAIIPLLTTKTNINHRQFEGRTALYFACASKNFNYVPFLLQQGGTTSLFIQDKSKLTPLGVLLILYKDLDLKNSMLSAKCYNLMDDFLIMGAGVCTELPSDCVLPEKLMENKIVIGLMMNSKPVTRQTKGFEKAITNFSELRDAINVGINFDNKILIKMCLDRLNAPVTEAIANNLKQLREVLYTLTPNSLTNLCLNFFNQSSEAMRNTVRLQVQSDLKEKIMPGEYKL